MSQVDYFLKIEGVQGESTDAKHKNEIDVDSWSWGETNGGTAAYGGGSGAGKVAMQDFNFVMRTNKASPKLMLACATGQHIPTAELVCRRAGGDQMRYLWIKLTDILVSSYQTGGSSGDIVPVDQISLNFSKIEYVYYMQNAKGGLDAPIKTGYDVKANKKL